MNSLKHNRTTSNTSTRSAGDGMEAPNDSEVPMPVFTHITPRFVPKEPYKAAIGLTKRDQERNKLLRRVDELERQVAHLNQQYKIQVDVNADLKKLLVASLGEDMQERVQFLTEDKQRLASEIAFYTEKLQKDINHIDELNIECDVWRTKYLAASLLVTELATVKAELAQRCDDFEKAIEEGKIERSKITNEIFQAYNITRETCHIQGVPCPRKHPQNLIECSQALLQMTEKLAKHFYVSLPSSNEVLGQTHSEITADVALNQYKALIHSRTSKACVQFDSDTDEETLRQIGVPTLFGCTKCIGNVITV